MVAQPLPASPVHFPQLLALNQAAVHFLSPLDAGRLASLHREAACLTVLLEGDTVLAFLLAFAPGAAYDSPNYRWFDSRYRDFLYVDRVVVTESRRHAGLGSVLYRDLFARARASGVAQVVCEYDLEPANPASAAFHHRLGFSEVGRQRVAAGSKLVSLQACALAVCVREA